MGLADSITGGELGAAGLGQLLQAVVHRLQHISPRLRASYRRIASGSVYGAEILIWNKTKITGRVGKRLNLADDRGDMGDLVGEVDHAECLQQPTDRLDERPRRARRGGQRDSGTVGP
jgi:hypothetical protein